MIRTSQQKPQWEGSGRQERKAFAIMTHEGETRPDALLRDGAMGIFVEFHLEDEIY